MGKIVRNLIVAAALVILILYVLGPILVSSAIQKTLGTQVSVKKLHFKLFPAEIGIYGLRIQNLKGYSEPALASIPEIFTRIDLLSFVTGSPRIEEINLNIESVTLEKNRSNKINLKEMLDFSKQKKQESQSSQPSSSVPSEIKQKKPVAGIRIDRATVSLGEVSFVLDSAQGKTVKKIPLHVDHVMLKDVTDGYSLTEQVVLEILKHIGVSALGIQMDIFSGDFQKQADEFILAAKGKLKQIFT